MFSKETTTERERERERERGGGGQKRAMSWNDIQKASKGRTVTVLVPTLPPPPTPPARMSLALIPE